MRLACIAPRYGAEILGGPELYCRLVAERLSAVHTVEVLTTCARDDTTWANAYSAGTDRIRGVTVRRFANAETRDAAAFSACSERVFGAPHTAQEEETWLRQHGPWCPALVEHLEQEHRSYDALIFFSCLHAPTVLGLRVAPRRSILVPAVCEHPALGLEFCKEVFARPAAIAYATAVESGFLRSRFATRAPVEEVVGCGVDLPPGLDPAQPDPLDDQVDDDAPAVGGVWNAGGPGAGFRRRHRLFGPFALCSARVRSGWGCEELIEYFGRYVAQHGDADLALMGVKLMEIPDEPFIRFAGTLPENDRLEAFAAASVVLAPAPEENTSLHVLEAFAAGTPVLANGRSDVLTHHCQRSDAGLYYADGDEFVECLRLLMNNAELREKMGRNGRRYVEEQYSWPVVLEKYDELIAAVAPRRGARRATGRSRGGKGRPRRTRQGGNR